MSQLGDRGQGHDEKVAFLRAQMPEQRLLLNSASDSQSGCRQPRGPQSRAALSLGGSSELRGYLCRRLFGKRVAAPFLGRASQDGGHGQIRWCPPSSHFRAASATGRLFAVVVVFYVCDLRLWTSLDPWKKGRGALRGRQGGVCSVCTWSPPVSSEAWSREAWQTQDTWEWEQGQAHLASPAVPWGALQGQPPTASRLANRHLGDACCWQFLNSRAM